jgi:hypothetical protein
LEEAIIDAENKNYDKLYKLAELCKNPFEII